jgi:hypothetical protein
LDRFGREYQIEETDEVKINGDVEYISWADQYQILTLHQL